MSGHEEEEQQQQPPPQHLGGSHDFPYFSGDHDGDHDMEEVMEKLSRVTEQSTLEDLIENLKSKLRSISGDSSPSTSPSSSSSSSSGSTHPEAGSMGHDFRLDPGSDDGRLLHADTITLLVSCIFMILLGLALRKMFLYLTQARLNRELYHSGLRQMAEHMHVVTRTISNEPANANASCAGAKPRPNAGRTNRVASSSSSSTSSRAPAETSLEVFRPSVHTMMKRDDSELGTTLTTQLDARRVSRMQNFLVNYD